MKKVILFILIWTTWQTSQAQNFNSSMAEIMKSMKAYTVEMITLIPENKLDTKPSDSLRTFRKQVQHMIATTHFLFNYQLKSDGKGDVQQIIKEGHQYAKANDKKALIKRLSDQFDEMVLFYEQATTTSYKKTYAFQTPNGSFVKDYFTVAMLIRDHISHHRSQLLVYLRLLNIKPAQYRGF